MRVHLLQNFFAFVVAGVGLVFCPPATPLADRSTSLGWLVVAGSCVFGGLLSYAGLSLRGDVTATMFTGARRGAPVCLKRRAFAFFQDAGFRVSGLGFPVVRLYAIKCAISFRASALGSRVVCFSRCLLDPRDWRMLLRRGQLLVLGLVLGTPTSLRKHDFIWRLIRCSAWICCWKSACQYRTSQIEPVFLPGSILGPRGYQAIARCTELRE